MIDAQRQLDKIVEEHLRLEHEHALDELMTTLAPNVVHDVVGWPDNPAIGHDAVRARYSRHFDSYNHISDTPLRRYYADNVVIDETLCEARVTGSLEGVTFRDHPLRYRVLHIFEVQDGKVMREQVWHDGDTIRQQLSLPRINATS